MVEEQELPEEQAEAPEEAGSEDHEDDESHFESEAAEGSNGDGGEHGKKRKKKKKHKKKKGGGSGGSSPTAAHAAEEAARREGQRRFAEALEQVGADSEDSMWVKLDGCHLHDTKAKKLAEALRHNHQCISLDLSSNHLTDEAAHALAAALLGGAVPDLIELKLCGNCLEDAGRAMLEEVQLSRKALKLELGPTAAELAAAAAAEAADAAEAAAKAAAEVQRRQQQQQQERQGNGALAGDGSANSSSSNNPTYEVLGSDFVRKYFQVGNDDVGDSSSSSSSGGGDAAGGEEGTERSASGLEPEQLSVLLWDQVLSCLDSEEPHIPSITEALRAISEQVEREMDSCVLPMLPDTALLDLKPFTQGAIAQLDMMDRVLALTPLPLLASYSKAVPVPAVGSHRTAVAELLAQLLRAECPAVAAAAAGTGLLPQLAALAVSHPNCNPLQCGVLKCLRVAVGEHCGGVGLWRQLLGSGGGGSNGGQGACLASDAAQIATTALGLPIGSRPPHVGFAVAAADILQAAATGKPPSTTSIIGLLTTTDSPTVAAAGAPEQQPGQQREGEQQQQAAGVGGGSGEAAGAAAASPPAPWRQELAAALAGSQPWLGFTVEVPLLREMLANQQGDLGGPRPAKRSPSGEMEVDLGGGGAGMISSQQLLEMLRGLSMGAFSGGM